PSPEEMEEMKKLVSQGMSEGALGLSSGLFYAPGSFSKTEEVVELAGTVKKFNGLYATHIRDESNYTIGLLESIKEAIEIGEKSGVPVQISHIKALGTPVWNLSDEVCRIIEEAQERGVMVMADQYPYVASSTSLAAAIIPRWVQEGGRMKERLQDPGLIEKIKTETGENISRRGGSESLVIVSYKPNHEYDGLSLAEISSRMDKPDLETAIALVINGNPNIISFNMNSDDVAYFMKKDYVMTSSDGLVQIPGSGIPHPRSYGAFPHKIRKYVLEDSLIGMEHAIRAATFLPAQMLGLNDRGQISEGYVADIVVFDPKTIRDVAAFGDPHQYSKGILYLLVNGQIVIEDEKYNGKLAGKTLRMMDYRK
ncbi:MAG: amidohydrolase family protein, partial [Bacteroidales bacterium]|nr:amidohydrolase family protein [Bacteroidales bacterium]